MKLTPIFFALSIAFSPLQASADTINLTAPLQAASLHDGDVDMVVYYLEHKDHFEVVATYLDQATIDQPSRLRMGLGDGDATTFSLPGLTHVSYSFERSGNSVSVTATDRRSREAALR